MKILGMFFWERHKNFSGADTIFIPKTAKHRWHDQCESGLRNSIMGNDVIRQHFEKPGLQVCWT